MSHEVGPAELVPWHYAWQAANADFYRAHEAELNFLTSVEMEAQVARKIATFVDQERSRHTYGDFVVVDIGSGSGRLLEQLRALVTSDVRFIGVDVRDRPSGLAGEITWRQTLIDQESTNLTGHDGETGGVVIAHEFLDDIPCDVVELDEDLAPRLLLVDPHSGTEELGPRLDDPAVVTMLSSHDAPAARAWLDTWWPATRPGARREIGLTRTRVWSMLRRIIDSGLAIAVDYAHGKAEREAGVWDAGTLKGFVAGRPTRPVADGSVNITAHVALDALAAPQARIAPQAQILGNASLSSWPAGLGSYAWLIESIDSGTMNG